MDYVIAVMHVWDDPERSGLKSACRLLWGKHQQTSGWRITDTEAQRGAAQLIESLRDLNLRGVPRHSPEHNRRVAEVRQRVQANTPIT